MTNNTWTPSETCIVIITVNSAWTVRHSRIFHTYCTCVYHGSVIQCVKQLIIFRKPIKLNHIWTNLQTTETSICQSGHILSHNMHMTRNAITCIRILRVKQCNICPHGQYVSAIWTLFCLLSWSCHYSNKWRTSCKQWHSISYCIDMAASYATHALC